MSGETLSFMDYWTAVDTAMMTLFGIDTMDADIDPDIIASAQEEGCTPQDFVRSLSGTHGLKTIVEPRGQP